MPVMAACRLHPRQEPRKIQGGNGVLQEAQIQFAQMLGYITDLVTVAENTDHLGRLLTGLQKKWNEA